MSPPSRGSNPLIKRLLWGRFPSVFRFGWLSFKRGTATGDTTFTIVGLGLMGVGLYLRRRRRHGWQHLYSGLLVSGERMQVRVFQGERYLGGADVEN